ncbi:MAG: hypothetical protein JWQ90_4493 [Hydrocarboniphaga sp.]|nr:hypothetical protein [Hydrocarboniphaga sp.]
MAHWRAYLQSGRTAEDLLREFLVSEECKQRAFEPNAGWVPSDLPGGAVASALSIAVIGNCQVRTLGRCIQALTGGPMPDALFGTAELMERLRQNRFQDLARYELLVVQPYVRDEIGRAAPELLHKVQQFPAITFSGFHPDLIYVRWRKDNAEFHGPLGPYHSSLLYFGWRNGKTVEQVLDLFNADVYRQLGFFDYMSASTTALIEEGERIDVELRELLAGWRRRGCFMHSINHPKGYVLRELAAALLKKRGVAMLPGNGVEYAYSDLGEFQAWPVYPEIAARYGVPGAYLFKLSVPGSLSLKPIIQLDLKTFAEQSYAAYASHTPGQLYAPDRAESEAYRQIFRGAAAQLAPTNTVSTPAEKTHPYAGLAPHHFWRSAVTDVAPDEVDPVMAPKFTIGGDDAIATAGSCFAQHIARQLQRHGMRYLVTEPAAPALDEQTALRRQYGVYSARYGNLYSARQLLQLLERSYGDFVPKENAWTRSDGRLADPFRPEIEPDGFASLRALEDDRAAHFAAVRQLFESLDVFVFTLGLTEAWRSRADGAVFPLAPGVAAGRMDFERYEFVNFGVEETVADLEAFLSRLLQINRRARVILTVSPVPLAATYEDRHVLTATAHSKAVLRVAADALARRHDACAYFPSYEIITGSFNRGAYYGADLRAVTPEGVDHVMRLFFTHYARGTAAMDADVLAEAQRLQNVVCEEERLDPGQPLVS